MEVPVPQDHDLEAKLLKARVKAKLFGHAEPVRIGRFELKRRCGEGGQGVVYEAFDPCLGRRVALKCLHADQVAAGGSLQREFRALARLVHPNLALLYELFCIDGRWFHTMELLSGVSFLSYVRAEGYPDERKLRDAVTQLLRGLAAIHRAGKVHRDLKPSNVLVEPEGRVVIVDYGLMVGRPAELAAATALPLSQRAGTLAYMAPEQMRREAVNAAADVYAVGVMLFEALTGERPAMPSASGLQTKAAVENKHPSRHAALVPHDLDVLCADLLTHDPRRRPSALEALSRLASSVPSASVTDIAPSSIAQECFVGRAAEREALHRAYARAQAGRATLALVHGESGMGKSALLMKLTDELRSSSAPPRLFVGRCYERENTPYKVFDGVMESVVDQLTALPEAGALSFLPREAEALAQIFPTFRRLSALHSLSAAPFPKDRPELRKRAFSAVRELFQRLCAQTPVVLCIDDLQWGDVDSMRLLQELLSPPGAPALLLVCAYRRSEVSTSPLLREALGEGLVHKLDCDVLDVPVDPLGMTEARELVRRAHGGRLKSVPFADSLDERIRAAAGMPFVLRELGDHETDASAPRESVVTPEAVVRRQRARCSAAAQTLLDVLCIAGRPLEMSLALRVADTGGDGWVAASELCAIRLARWRDTHGERCLEPYHDLIRQAFVPQADHDQVRRVHASIVQNMEVLTMDEPAHIVHHLIAAGERQRAGEVAITAAQRAAQKLAWDTAAELLGLALELLPHSHAATYTLYAQHGEALAFAGRHRRSAAAYRRGAALAPKDAAAHLSRNAAQQLMRAGDVHSATALLQELLSETGLRYPSSETRALAIYLTGHLRRSLSGVPKASPTRRRPAPEEQRLATLAAVYAELWLVDPVRALAIHSWFFEEACRSRDRYRLQALTWETSHLAVVQGPSALARATQLLAAIDEQAEGGLPYDRATALSARAVCLIHVERRPRDALSLLLEADRILSTECTGTHFERCWLSLMRDYVLETAGNFAELSETVLQHERGKHDDGYTTRRLLVSLPLVKLAHDEPQAALHFLQTGWQRSKGRATISDFTALVRLSTAQLYQDDALTSFETLKRAWLWLRVSGIFHSAPVRELAEFHRARSAATLYFRTRDPHWRNEARFREWKVFARSAPEMRGLTCLVEASLARAEGRNAACRALLLEATQDFRRCQNDTAYWAVQYRLAQVNEARDALSEARGWMCTHGIQNPERWVTLFVPGPSDFRGAHRLHAEQDVPLKPRTRTTTSHEDEDEHDDEHKLTTVRLRGGSGTPS